MADEKRRRLLAAAGIALLIITAAAVFWFAGMPLVELVSDPESFRAWVASRGLAGKLAFIGMVTLQIVVAIIPGEPFEIGAGYAFGALEGTGLCLLGSALGSAVIFALVRSFGIKLVEVFFSRDKISSLSFLQNTKKLNALVFAVFAIPGSPKDLLSYCVGLTGMKFITWLGISTVARIPSIITSTLGGDALGAGRGSLAIWVFAITVVMSVSGLLLFNYYCKKQNREQAETLREAV